MGDMDYAHERTELERKFQKFAFARHDQELAGSSREVCSSKHL